MSLTKRDKRFLGQLYLNVALLVQRHRVMAGRRRPVAVPPIGPELAKIRALIARGKAAR